MTFVLIHGAWHGAWCWRRVAPLLRAAGHEVFAPSLTGLGERAHLARPDTGLETHIADVVMLLEMEDLEDVILVGHSYAGMVITGAAGRAPERIRRLVYLDAFLPEDGKAAIDYIPPERATRQREQAEKAGSIEPLSLAGFGVTAEEDARWVSRHLVRQPARTFLEPVRIANPAALARMERIYIDCDSATGTFTQFAAKVRADPSWRFFELPCGHDAMVIDPQAVARLLLQD
ncbi:MAG: alpha/beta fold hydrolase [Betaproteobacteria bacterium]|nr:alpha/beta fold hydrolase [Betaproteobacteria bacterium]